jgi:23S rRNA (uracil-5-)-methyltransferase RumA
MKKNRKRFIELAARYRGGASPFCRHFGECGGCMFQDISYEDQLTLKREYLSSVLGFEAGRVHPSGTLRYRNRMDFVTAFGKAGLRKQGTYRHVVDIESCEIMQESSNSVFAKLRPLLAGIEDYDYLSHRGYLRYAVLRQGMFTGQVMCNFVVSRREDRLERVAREMWDSVDSMSLILSEGRADLSFGEILHDLKGGAIEESLEGTRLLIRPNSFFQSNSDVTLQMYRRIREEVSGRVLDLYCGVGSISLFVSPAAERVTGVEILGEAVDAASENRELNGIGNAEFVRADARDFLRGNEDRFTTVILDPPRSGIHPKMVQALNQMKSESILYMSCNPASFRDDLAGLDAYRLEKFEAFDMFPETPHIETLAVLRRR